MCIRDRHKRLGIGNVTDHRLWRMVTIVLICFSLFLSIDLGAAMLAPSYSWLRESASVISSFLLQDIPRHPDTRLFEVREAFKRSFLLLGFQAHIRAYIATDGEPSINALIGTLVIPRSMWWSREYPVFHIPGKMYVLRIIYLFPEISTGRYWSESLMCPI